MDTITTHDPDAPKADTKPPCRTTVWRRAYNRKVNRLTLGDLDGRTNAARRARELIRMLSEAHGGPGDVTVEQQLRIVDLACLNTMTEDMATRFFQGESIDRAEFALLVNAKRRALDSLA